MEDSGASQAVSPDVLSQLREVTAATVSMQLVKRGIRRCWIKGPLPVAGWTGDRLVGPAYTLRFLPLREDLSTPESYKGPRSIRQAIEAMPPGRVVVIEAMGETGCGTLGDILAARLQKRGALGVVTDGALRDLEGIRALDWPCFATGAAALPSIASLFFADWECPVACGGVAVLPGDIVVADSDGAVVLPHQLAEEVARDAPEQERFERFAQLKVEDGAPVLGLYPPDEATLAAYEAWCAAGEPGSGKQ